MHEYNPSSLSYLVIFLREQSYSFPIIHVWPSSFVETAFCIFEIPSALDLNLDTTFPHSNPKVIIQFLLLAGHWKCRPRRNSGQMVIFNDEVSCNLPQQMFKIGHYIITFHSKGYIPVFHLKRIIKNVGWGTSSLSFLWPICCQVSYLIFVFAETALLLARVSYLQISWPKSKLTLSVQIVFMNGF